MLKVNNFVVFSSFYLAMKIGNFTQTIQDWHGQFRNETNESNESYKDDFIQPGIYRKSFHGCNMNHLKSGTFALERSYIELAVSEILL